MLKKFGPENLAVHYAEFDTICDATQVYMYGFMYVYIYQYVCEFVLLCVRRRTSIYIHI
jgi:hypothetical protein